jgi:hypothetical protein
VSDPPRTAETHRAVVQYPGGLTARYRWTGSGGAAALFELTEAGGPLVDLGSLLSDEPDRLCRAELRVESPVATWTVRLASKIFDEPRGLLWDTPGLLVVGYGFSAYGLETRTGELRWRHRGGTPLVAVLGSSRLAHVIVQSEIETVALGSDGAEAWRVGHGDVIVEAELIGGRLVLATYDGSHVALDPATGKQAR